MNVALFGGNGFLGRSITRLLKSQGIAVYTISRSGTHTDFTVDISNFASFQSLPVDFFDIVIDCAVVLPGGDYLDNQYLDAIYQTNILGAQNICKWIAAQHSVKKIINCSTLVVVGKPWNVDLTETEKTYPTGNHVLYCSSKLMQELLFKTFADAKAITLTQIRFSALYGPEMNWSGLICNLIDQAKTSKKITVHNGTKVFADFLHIEDAAQIISAVVKKDYNGILNGASGVETSVLQLAQWVAKANPGTQVFNTEDEAFAEQRAQINIDTLNTLLPVAGFIPLKNGIGEMVNL